VGVGPDPSDLAYDSAKGEVFVSNFGGPTVSVISDATSAVLATIEVPGLNANTFRQSPSPVGIAYDSGKGEIFVSNFYGNDVTVISDATNTVIATIDLGNDAENGGLGVYPHTVAYDAAKGEVFVANIGVSTIVGNYSTSAGTISVISDANNSVVATIPVGSYPEGLAYDSAKGELFVTNYSNVPSSINATDFKAGSVSVISDTTNTVVATVPVGPTPGAIAYDSSRGELFVTSEGSSATSVARASVGTVSVISDTTNSVVATVPVAGGAIAYDSGKGELFVVVTQSNSTSVISDATNSVVATKAAGPDPYAIVYDPAQSELFVANYDAATVTVLSDATAVSTTTVESTTSSSSSSLAFQPSYLAVVAINVVLVLVLGALVATRRNSSKTAPSRALARSLGAASLR
jgi:YVTN family beta-propeller protein